MGRAGDEVRVYRFGRAREHQAHERIRWAYAVFVPEQSLAALSTLLQGGQPPIEEVSRVVSALALEGGAIQGVDAVRRAGQQDARLRRALREARQALRKGRGDEATK